MKKRIGNDLPIEVEVKRNGQAEDLSAVSSLSVQIKSAFGKVMPFDYIVEGNKVRGVFWGKDQDATGDYLIELVENQGMQGMASIDARLVTLVDRTSKEADADDTGLCVAFDIVPEGVSLAAVITAARNGLSAYELAVLDGFTGSVHEWLISLKGKSIYQLMVDAGRFEGTEEEFLDAYDEAIAAAWRAAAAVSEVSEADILAMFRPSDFDESFNKSFGTNSN